ncbi:unnamed protein product [Adineta ricciae]|uniref:Uncharacterized protein n=1 Tax=Adineta ricciae TaxID=249248 RepID=A0A815UAQ3_ADIRI|nr:unnamed protein product [Adineta ricciae]
MTSTVSSVFSTNSPSNNCTIHDEVDLGDILSTFSSKNALIPTSALNSCYQKALSLLRDYTKEAASQLDAFSKPVSLSYNVTEDDFDTTVFPDRLLTPSSVTICQWRHEQFLNEKFLRLLLPLVAESMHAIVLNWFEVELHNEEERQRKTDVKKNELRELVFELKSMAKSIDIDRLYELSGSSKDVLVDQVDWKLIGTKMRSKGGFKYFDEYSLRRIWLHRCQYGVNTSWSDEEDDMLNQLVQQFGFGKWMEIAQHELFQKKKKSAYMCARRYMTNSNKLHAKRRFAKSEKEHLLSIYKHRCSVVKDYRFCVSHAAYLLGDRGIREITHVWTYINPNVEKSSFTPEEDAIILQQASQTASVCWTTLAGNLLPNRSAVQCRQRYVQLMKAKSTAPRKRTTTKKKKK